MSSLIGRFVFQKNDATPAIETVFDTAFSGAQVQAHGNLAGLADDDHTQYLLVDGSRPADVFDVTGALTALSYGGITEANLLDKSATEQVDGSWTFNNNLTRITGTAIQLRFLETGGTLNEGAWRFLVNTDQFLFGTLADDETGGNPIFLVTRTGTTPDKITFSLDVDISGALTAATLVTDGAGDSSFVGNVGIGTASPQKNLHIQSTVPTIRLSDSDAGTDQAVATLIEFYRENLTNRVGFWGMASSSNDIMSLATDYAAGEIVFSTGSNVEAAVNSQAPLIISAAVLSSKFASRMPP